MIRDTTLPRVLTTSDPASWRSVLPASRSAFGSVEFASIAERHLRHSARLFVLSDGEESIVYPFFLRSVSGLPFAAHLQIETSDTVSPDYTGPVANAPVTQSTPDRFRRCFAEYCRQEGIITEFAHLHPWNRSTDFLEKDDVFLEREVVYVDVTMPEEQMWRECFTHSCSKNIKRALAENVRVFLATRPEEIEEFYRIYIGTMDRRCAQPGYYFPLSYFMALFQQMSDNATFLLAEYKNQIIAATLYLHDDCDVYSYLGGADHAFQHVRPTNAVVCEAINWSRSRGKKRLILGGGYQPGDGVFRFKASFSPLRAKFYVYKRIHNPDVYAELCRAWCAHYCADVKSNGYFPAYRRTPSSTETDGTGP
jgi:serine/alanine adding enzyme